MLSRLWSCSRRTKANRRPGRAVRVSRHLGEELHGEAGPIGVVIGAGQRVKRVGVGDVADEGF